MKSVSQFFIVSIFLSVLFCFTQCKKDKSPVNISLYDKPLSIIQSNIQGKWKLEYEKGGICGSCIFYVNNYLWEFRGSDNVRQTYKDTLIVDTVIKWVHEKNIFNDLTYTMNFSDKRGYPYVYFVNSIYNDTLVISDGGYDPISYYLTKLN